MFALLFPLLLTGVVGFDAEWCAPEARWESCSKFCEQRPDDCKEVCRKFPKIRGCSSSETPPELPAPCNPEACCKEQTAECLACQACKEVEDWCAENEENRETPGCDKVCCELGCSKECTKEKFKDIIITRKCKWLVLDQQFEAFRPTLLMANVEKSCPFMAGFELHLEACQQCAKLHKPCSDQYVACGGCCGTPWHSLLGLAINTNHNCSEVKNYFAKKNSAVVECEEETPENKEVGTLGIQVVNATQPRVIDEGVLESTCKTEVTKLECKKIPFVLKFECDDCGNKGTPDLLNQCCDKCVEWSQNLKNHSNLDPSIEPYVWCSGCNATQIEPENPLFPPMPWYNAYKYVNHTEKEAYSHVDDYLEEEVCGALPGNCPAEEETHPTFLAGAGGRRLTEDNCYSESGGGCAALTFNISMNPCTDPKFPYQNTNVQRPQFCYSSQEFADAMTGPCDSWCSLSSGRETDNDGCDGCCGEFEAKLCELPGGRRMLQSPPAPVGRRLQSPEAPVPEDTEINCKEFDISYYDTKPQNDAPKPKNDAPAVVLEQDSPEDTPATTATPAESVQAVPIPSTSATEVDFGLRSSPGLVLALSLSTLLSSCF